MKLRTITGGILLVASLSASADVVITGIVDGTLPGGTPKAIELYISGTEDLAQYRLERAANSNDFPDGQLALSGTFTDQFVYLVGDTSLDDDEFLSVFGNTGDFANIIAGGSIVSGNGNDAFRIIRLSDNAVIDQIGEAQNSSNIYRDSFMYRIDETGPDGGFDSSNWINFEQNDELDNLTAFEIGNMVPFGSYSPSFDEPVEVGKATISEFVVSDPGNPDELEFVELVGVGGTSLQGLSLISIDNDFSPGVIQFRLDFTGADVFDENGFFIVGNQAGLADTFEVAVDIDINDLSRVNTLSSNQSLFNNDQTIAIVETSSLNRFVGENYSGDEVVQSAVAIQDNNDNGDVGKDFSFIPSAPVLGPDGNFLPGGIFLCPDIDAYEFYADFFGLDTNATPRAINSLESDGQCSDGIEVLPIHEIQGDSSASPFEGAEVTTSGIVVGDFQGVSGSSLLSPVQIEGFFIQTPDAEVDTNADTSEGLFIFCDDCTTEVNVGDLVTVTGVVVERFGLTSIENPAVVVESTNNTLPSAGNIDLPVSSLDDYEAFEGMLVRFSDTLVVSEYFQLGRFGQIVLFEGERPYQFTHLNSPDATELVTYEETLAKRSIILDDDANGNNQALGNDLNVFYPIPGLSVGNFFRGGYTIEGLTGVLDFGFGDWRIRPVTEVFQYSFEETNPRPTEVDDVGGTLKVVNTNVLNFFTTIDTTSSTSSGDCGVDGLDCRGADSESELTRHALKLRAAICEMDGDIVGLVEIENNADDSAKKRIVEEVREQCGIEYNYVPTGFIGTDAIQVGLLYKNSVSPIGDTYIVDNSIDENYQDNRNRPTLIQEFKELSSGESLIVAVHHLKSKGSSCDSTGDVDTGDGQGNCNLTRTAAANIVIDFINETVIPNASTDKVLAIGDLNAYKKEDPITAFINSGYEDLIEKFVGEDAYSFVFSGQLGYLDHALGLNVEDVVTGVTEWNINADEINLFDYNDDVLDPGERSFEEEPDNLNLFESEPYRFSDHDPVIIGVDLSAGITPISGDINADGVVDRADVNLVLAARNQPAEGENDPRDMNGDGFINVLDARLVVLACNLSGCRTPR